MLLYYNESETAQANRRRKDWFLTGNVGSCYSVNTRQPDDDERYRSLSNYNNSQSSEIFLPLAVIDIYYMARPELNQNTNLFLHNGKAA